LTHDADKLIRQLSLVAYLMAEQRPVTARDVKLRVEGYANMGDEAFARRFYADRSELQGLGVPIASVRDEFTSEELYSLREEHYFLPPVELTDPELAALQTSFYLLEGQFAYAEPLRLALQNLALGRAWPVADPGPKTATVELLGPSYTSEVAQRLAKLEQAISRQRTARFRYWTIGTDSEAERTVNPYGLFELNGVWYVVGDDLDRPEDSDRRRTFRVSRIRGEIKFATRRERDFRMPADFNVTAYRDRAPWKLSADEAGTATVTVAADSSWLVQRLYGAYGEFEELADGSARFTTAYSQLESLSAWILSQAGRVVPVEPAAVVDAVVADLQAVADALLDWLRSQASPAVRHPGQSLPVPTDTKDVAAATTVSLVLVEETEPGELPAASLTVTANVTVPSFRVVRFMPVTETVPGPLRDDAVWVTVWAAPASVAVNQISSPEADQASPFSRAHWFVRVFFFPARSMTATVPVSSSRKG